MKRKTLLVAAIAASLALGSVAAFAETGVTDVFEINTEAAAVDAPALSVQTQLRTQVQDPELMGTEDALMATVRTRLKAQLHDPLEMGTEGPAECDGDCDQPMNQERVEVRSEFHNGEATQDGELLQDRDRDQVRDPLFGDGDGDGECDGECDGNGVGDGPGNTQDQTGAGNQYGTPGGKK